MGDKLFGGNVDFVPSNSITTLLYVVVKLASSLLALTHA